MIKKNLIFASVLVLLTLNLNAQQTGTLTDDRDGKTYKTVEIGNQWWMAENLRYNVSGSRVYTNKADKGYIYTWQQAQQDVCPDGWRLPIKDDFKTLLARYPSNYGEDAYYSLKKGGKSGFDAELFVKNGCGDDYCTTFWSSTSDNRHDDGEWAYWLILSSSINSADLGSNQKELWGHVRCIKE